jgi:hypothetical protein
MPSAMSTMSTMSTMTHDQAFAVLVTLTGISKQDWDDILELPSEDQATVLQAYRDADWRKSADTFADVLQVLNVIGAIAGDVSGIAGAVTAVAALKSL